MTAYPFHCNECGMWWQTQIGFVNHRLGHQLDDAQRRQKEVTRAVANLEDVTNQLEQVFAEYLDYLDNQPKPSPEPENVFPSDVEIEDAAKTIVKRTMPGVNWDTMLPSRKAEIYKTAERLLFRTSMIRRGLEPGE